MPIDFAAEGLLDGLEGDAREGRRRLLEELAADGVELEELRRAVEQDRLALLLVERHLDSGRRYKGAEVAEKSGIELDFLIALRRANGLAVPEPDEAVFDEDDVEVARIVSKFLDAGLPPDGILENARVLASSLAQVAQTGNAVVGQALAREGDSEYELAHRLRDAAAELLPQLGSMVERMLRLHTREQVRLAAVGGAELAAGTAGVRPMAVAFADLVGFTRLGETVEPERLGEVARRVASLTSEVIRPPVRMIKTIGDAAMLVSPEPKPLLDASLDLLEAAESEGEDFPQLHVGMGYGEALNRAGDWYGRPVNLASRIADAARPGSVLVARAVKEALDGDTDGYRFSSAGKRHLKGISGEVELYRVRRRDSEPAD